MYALPRKVDSRSRVGAWTWRSLGALVCVAAATAQASSFRDLTLEQALRRLEQQGLDVLYSSDLVLPSMQVRDEPTAAAPRAILEEIVRPHGLAVRDGPNGLLLLVRAAPGGNSSNADPRADAVIAAPAALDLEEVIVSASEYTLVHGASAALATLSATDLQLSPDIGDDPLRAIARLPGMAASEFSARTNMRGGDADETLVRFDGLNLQNPFHLKDFQSAFSTIGPGIVREMRIYSGGFPVTFGDRMSGVIDIDPLSLSEPHRELSLSFFNAAALAGAQSSDGRGEWLVSARRGNLDLIVDALGSNIGRPAYSDFYGRGGRRITDSLSISASALVSNDALVLFDSDHEEQARAEYRDGYYWLTVGYQPSDAISGNVLVAHSNLDSVRRGRADQEGVARGTLSDERAFAIDSLQADWSWRLDNDVLLLFGGEWREMRGRYDYSDEVELDLLFDVPGAAHEVERARSVTARPVGDHYALYTNVRFGTPLAVIADAGVRWDRDTLTPDSSDQLSPRISLLYPYGERWRMRAVWGRFFQAQSISELQVSDGMTQFFPPQRAHHLIGSIEYRHDNGVEARLEAYRKDYRRVRPRFENLLNTFVLLPELKPDRIRIAPARAIAMGMELTLRRDAGQPLSWWLSYSRSSVKDYFASMSTPRSWDQRHLFNGGIAWRGPRWEVSLAGTYHTGWPTSAVVLRETEPVPLLTTGPRNDRRMHDYRSLDARVARLFRIAGAGVLTVFVEASNILNRSNDCCVEYELEDEEEDLRLDINTLAYLPITPSLGFVWRF